MNYSRKKMLNRIVAMLLATVMTIAVLPTDVFAVEDTESTNFAMVTALTGGTVDGNGTADVKVTVEETTLQWVEADDTLGRTAGWWVGINVTAPDGYSEDGAQYKVCSDGSDKDESYGNAKLFSQYKDGGENGNYIGLWFPVSEESLNDFKEQDRNLTMMYKFDWNADEEYEQKITFSVVPSEKIVLMKGEDKVYPKASPYAEVTALTGGEVTGSGTANVEVEVTETTLQWVEEDQDLGRAAGWWVGINVTAPEGFSENATYMRKGNPNDEYNTDEQLKFAEKRDGENYIGLWFPVSTDSLIKFANEDRNLTMMYTFDWNADDTYEQEITFSVVPSDKIVLMKGEEKKYPLAAEVTALTGGEVTGSGTENVVVKVTEVTLQWSAADASIGRMTDGWWVGINVIAPEGYSENATYMRKGNPNDEYNTDEELKFTEKRDGENYIGMWFPVTPEAFMKFIAEDRDLTMMYTFDWNADGAYEQEITFSVAPSEKIVLMKGEEQIYPVINNIAASLVPTSEANENGYYNSNVTFKVGAEETSGYYGLALVEYWITCDSVASEKVELYKHTDVVENTFENTDKLVVDTSLYSSKDVKVSLRAVGRDGNEKTVDYELKINATKPEVSLDITGTQFDNAKDGYYNAARELSITVVDREDTFSAENFIAGFDVKKNGTKVTIAADAIEWETAPDGITHYGKYTFSDDGHYEWSVSYTNLAGLSDDTVTAPADKFIYDFYIDKVAPSELKITYNPNITFVEGLVEKLIGFSKETVTVRIEAVDVTAGIEQFEYSYVVEEGTSDVNRGIITADNITYDEVNKNFYAEFEIPAQFRGNVEFAVTDKAGRTAKLVDEDIIVVDDVAPDISVEYKGAAPQNEKYYNANRTATIKITEANFFAQDIEDGLLKISRTKVSNEGVETEETFKPTFEKEGDDYTATVLFDEEVDYTFDIKYTDRAGNEGAYSNSFTVDKTKPVISIEEANGAYFTGDRTVKITVVEHNFRASDFEFTAVAKDVYGNSIELSSKKYTEFLKDKENWDEVEGKENTWESEITFDIEGNYTIDATYTDLAGNPQEEAIHDTFCVDKTKPSGLKITYNDSDFLGTLLESITFGFYQATVEVKVEAIDDIAGVEYFEYSYLVEEGASTVNKGEANKKVSAIYSEENDNFYVTFPIEPQFRGKVSFVAIDKATNSISLEDSNSIVVDDVKPVIEVTYSPGEAKNDSYYNANRTATIKITEANFFAQDIEDGLLKITRKKVSNEGAETVETLKPTFESLGDDVYSATIPFNENMDYTMSIDYTDRSGNKADGWTDSFTVDTIKPIISIEEAKGAYFTEDRTVKITVVEHNFRASDFEFTAVAKDFYGNSIELSSKKYTEFLKDKENWDEVEGEVNTWESEITFDIEGNYTIGATYTDLAGNVQEEAISDTFCVDKTPPEMDIKIAGESVVATDENVLVFNKFYQNSVKVELLAECSISGVATRQYQMVKSIDDYDATAGWTVYDATTGIVVEPTEKLVIYFKSEDIAGNTNVIRTTGIIVDNKEPTGGEPTEEVEAPEIVIDPTTGNDCGIHNGDVTVKLEVHDPKFVGENPSKDGYYSGLKEISYEIYEYAEDVDTNKEPKESGKLFSSVDSSVENKGTVIKDDDNLVQQWKGEITINAESLEGDNDEDVTTFNSNSIIVKVRAVDNAGNVRISSTTPGAIKIDTTEPIVTVNYDNHNVDSGVFFKAPRRAIITIEERNFDPNDVYAVINGQKVEWLTEQPEGTYFDPNDWSKAADYYWYPSDGETNPTNYKDGRTYTLFIPYVHDGTYSFNIGSVEYDINGEPIKENGVVKINSFIDMADNKAVEVAKVNEESIYVNYLAPASTQFVIDKTRPVVHVTYDNNNSMNEKYYKDARTATITINEANLDPNGADSGRIEIYMTAEDDGHVIANPEVSYWKSNSGSHTATINYTADGYYTFDIVVRDKAGNYADDFYPKEFYIDRTAPSLEITGVANNSANAGNVIPVITYSDTNWDPAQVSITLTGANRGGVALDGAYTDIHNGRVFTFRNFAKVQSVDDIYTLTATLTDKAGNTTTETINFSVNRFGSTYAMSEETKALNGTYVQEPIDVVVTETNADALDNIKITLFKNNQTLDLVEGEDYKITLKGGNGNWYQYTYTVFKKNFAEDGVYRLTFHSEDAAGNIAENTLDTKEMEIGFGVDATKPDIVIANIADGVTYALENITVNMSINDNLLLKSIKVYLDNVEVKQWNAEEITAVYAENGEFTFDIPGDSKSAHEVKVVSVDAAGNEAVETISGFYVTTDILVRYVNNKPLFYGSVSGTCLLAGLMIFLIVFLRKRKEDEE